MSFPTGPIAVLPLKNTVVFPGVSHALRVGRDKSLKAVDLAAHNKNWIITLAQKNPEQNLENVDGLFETGTLCKIESVKGNHEDGYFIVVRGYYRVQVSSFKPESEIFMAYIHRHDDISIEDSQTEEAFLRSLRTLSLEILKKLPQNTETIQDVVNSIEDLSLLSHVTAAHVDLNSKDKQNLLESISTQERVMQLLSHLQNFKNNLEIQNEIKNKLQQKIGQNQKEHILREHLKTIKEELGDGENDLTSEYQQKILQSGMQDEALELAQQQLKKLSQTSSQSPEHQMLRTHLDLMVNLPWAKSSSSENKHDFSIAEAEKTLNSDHYGLDKIKKRILQHLAVISMNKNKKGSILLLVGPPGVGKTSLGQSIAKALNKKYQRISLGGLRDESEIRGHRRTYIGALPGRFINAIKKAGENDPVIILDEIDKLSRSYAGDPSAALLEVLDPEQNSTFVDHYLDTAFDLSSVFFIATANSLDGIPLPLLDRMEVIDLNGYTTAEKLHIAKTHLIPKQKEEHGLSQQQIEITDDALMQIILHFTREAGVRDLQRKIAQVFRYCAEKVLRSESINLIESHLLEDIFGQRKYTSEVADLVPSIGVVTGLAWTPVGGDILFIETAIVPGRGELIITGQLGDVMKESAQIARSLIKARLQALNPLFDFQKFDIHLHVPSGSIPKDGPSAGITLLTSMASLVTRHAVQPKLAMTGEISLRGKVLPVGGIKEKVIAAHRAGITEIILCKKNETDLRDVPQEIKEQLKFYFVENINEVLTIALNIDLSNWSDELLFNTQSQIPTSSVPQA